MSDIKVLGNAKIEDSEDFDSYEMIYIVQTKLSGQDLINALEEEFYSSCSCAHDCCGHWFTNVWTHKTKQLGGDLLAVFVNYNRNV